MNGEETNHLNLQKTYRCNHLCELLEVSDAEVNNKNEQSVVIIILVATLFFRHFLRIVGYHICTVHYTEFVQEATVYGHLRQNFMMW